MGRPLLRIAPIAVSTLVALLVGGALAAPAGAREPTRLWYRIAVEFDGELRRTIPPTPPSGVSTRFIDRQDYRLASRSATVVTRACWERRPNGSIGRRFSMSCADARRALAGRANAPLRRRLRESWSFRARVAGSLSDRRDTVSSPISTQAPDGTFVPCPQGSTRFFNEITLLRQPMSGVIGSTGGSGSGVTVSARPTSPTRSDLTGTDSSCLSWFDERGAAIDPPRLVSVPFPNQLAKETLYAAMDDRRPYIKGRNVSEQLTFTGRRFGKALRVARTLTETGAPRPPAASDAFQTLLRYRYVITFRPCPNGGRRARRC